MNEDKILVPLDDYEEKAKDQRTVEIIRDMVIREGDVAVNTLECRSLPLFHNRR